VHWCGMCNDIFCFVKIGITVGWKSSVKHQGQHYRLSTAILKSGSESRLWTARVIASSRLVVLCLYFCCFLCLLWSLLTSHNLFPYIFRN
jgi:hypothetical protein